MKDMRSRQPPGGFQKGGVLRFVSVIASQTPETQDDTARGAKRETRNRKAPDREMLKLGPVEERTDYGADIKTQGRKTRVKNYRRWLGAEKNPETEPTREPERGAPDSNPRYYLAKSDTQAVKQEASEPNRSARHG